jgi:hypothetical protein
LEKADTRLSRRLGEKEMAMHRTGFAKILLSFAAATALGAGPAIAGEQPALSSDAKVSVVPLTANNCSTFCAVVNADGSLSRGHAFTTSSTLGTGIYQVNFYTTATAPKNISKCVWLATPGFGTFSGDQAATFVTTAGRAGTTNAVWVHTFDQTGASVNAPFLLELSC